MRVVHCDFGRTWRGGQHQLLLLARALEALGCRQVVVAHPGVVLERFQAEGVEVRPAGLSAVRTLRHAEVMHAHDGRALGWMLAAGWGASGRRVLSRRVAFPVGSLAAWKYRRLDLVLAVSEFVREQVIEAGVAPQRVWVVPDGIDLASLPSRERRGEWRERLGIPAAAPCLVSLGAFTAEKGIPDLIAALALLPAAYLALGGEGEQRLALEQQARARGVASRVAFAGGLGAAELVAAGDVFVMPSRQEGLGSASLIAMGLGVPIVATRAGGIPELIRDGENGVLAAVADPPALAAAIASLLADPARAGRLAEAGRAVVGTRYSAAAMGSATMDAYRRARRAP